MNRQPAVPSSKTGGEKKCVDAVVLAEALLDYALKPAGPELERNFSPHYLDELLFFKMFTVDYVLWVEVGQQSRLRRCQAALQRRNRDGLRWQQ
jgi:hypothetical protein